MADRSVVLRIRADIADAQRKLGQLGDTVKANATAIQKSSADWDKMGTTLTRAGLVGAAGLGFVTKAAIDWESAWAGVNKTVDGTPAQMAELEAGLRNLATTLPATHSEIAGVAEAAGQLGVAQKDILGFTKTMVDLGTSTNLTADDAATAIAQISNVMGTMKREGSEGVARFGATLVELGNNGASTERDIVEMASRIAGAAKVVGLSESDLLAVSNALASVGVDAEAGGTAISKVLIDMSKAVQTGSADLDRFAKVSGVSGEQFAAAFRDRPAEAMNLFTQGLARIKTEGGDVFTTLSDLGQSDVRVSTALLKMSGAGDLLTQSLADGARAWEQNSALTNEAAKRYETSASRIQVAQNKIRDASIDAGGALAPFVTEAAESVGALAQGFAGLDESTQGTIVQLTLLTTGLALTGGLAIKATTSILTMKTAMEGAGVAGARLATVLKAMGAATILLGIAAVANELAQLAPDAEVAQVNVDKLAASLGGLTTGGDTKELQELFGGEATGLFADDIDTASKAMDQFALNAQVALGNNWGDRVEQWLTPTDAFSNQVGQLDRALAQMVASGDVDKAAAGFDRFMGAVEEANKNGAGIPVDEVRAMFTVYGGAVQDAAAKTGTVTTQMHSAFNAATSLAGGLEDLSTSSLPVVDGTDAVSAAVFALGGTADVASDQVKDLAKAIQAQMDAAGKAFSSDFDVLGKYDPEKATGALDKASKAVIDADKRVAEVQERIAAKKKVTVSDNQTLEHAQAAAAEARAEKVKAADEATGQSLEALYGTAVKGAKSFSSDIKAATEAGLDPGVVAHLLQAGPEQAAPILQELLGSHGARMIKLVNDSERQLSEVNEAIVQQSRLTAIAVNAGTDEIAGHLDEATRIISAKTAAHGKVTAEELAAKLKLPLETVKQVAIEYGITLEETIPPEVGTYVKLHGVPEAVTAADVFQRRVNQLHGKDITIGVRYNAGALPNGGRDLTGGITKGAADGGAIFGPGSGTSDSIPVRLSNNEHVWTAAEVGAAGGHDAVYRLRAMVRSGQLQGFAAGGSPGYAGPKFLPTAGMNTSTVSSRKTVHHTPVNVERLYMQDYGELLDQARQAEADANIAGGLM